MKYLKISNTLYKKFKLPIIIRIKLDISLKEFFLRQKINILVFSF